jgi:protein SCO1/2
MKMNAAHLVRHCILSMVISASVMFSGQAAPARAQASAPGEAGVDERLGAQVALDAVLKDEGGNDVTLRQLISKPTILTLNYFTCPGICSPLLNALADSLNQLPLDPGKDFQVITMSFDPSDTPEVAHHKRMNYLKQMKRPFPPAAWRFLTGSAQATKVVTDSVGFNFLPAPNGGFVHPGVLVVLTPKGIVSRYMYGIRFLPADVQMAIQDAASGHVRPTISRILAFCYSYDPQRRGYVLSITRLTGAAVLVFAAVFMIFVLRGKSRSNKGETRLPA